MLLITGGDPYSINQSCLMRLAPLWSRPQKGPVVLVGSRRQWLRQSQKFAWPSLDWQEISSWEEAQAARLYFFPIDGDERDVEPEELSEIERGGIANRALWSLRSLPLPEERGRLAVLTGPIDKKASASAGFAFPGQTEFFEDLWKTAGIMLLAGPQLRVALATNHMPLAAVTSALSVELIRRKIRLLGQSLQEVFQIAAPRLAVAAVNPHAGDHGLFGSEDQLIVQEAVKAAKREGWEVSGPYPADTVFFRAYQGAFDGVLAMYHDQGLGPLKTVHFYDAINVTGGLPALRLSPDHGPASDLYGSEAAREDSFRLALQQAHHYLKW